MVSMVVIEKSFQYGIFCPSWPRRIFKNEHLQKPCVFYRANINLIDWILIHLLNFESQLLDTYLPTGGGRPFNLE